MQHYAAALRGAKATKDVTRCISDITGYLSDRLSTNGRQKADDYGAILSIIKLLVAKIDSEAENLEQLLKLADSCFACYQRSAADSKSLETYNVLLYSYFKKLVALKRFSVALQHGRQLLAHLQQGVGTDGASSKSTEDLVLGAALSVIICTCKIDRSISGALSGVNTAAMCLLDVLRVRSQQAAQHAVVQCKYLLQLLTMVSVEASQESSSKRDHSAGELTQLLVHTWIAADMTQQEGMLQQVAFEVVRQLPSDLKHYSIVAMLQAAVMQQSRGSSKPAGTPALLPAAAAVAGLQALMAAVTSKAATAAACCRGLLSWGQCSQLCLEGCMIMAVLASQCGNILDSSEAEEVASAAMAAMQRHSSNTAAEQQVDELTGQLSKVTIADVEQHDSTSSRTGRKQHISKQKAGPLADSLPQPADGAACMEVQAWCIQQLLKLKQADGPMAHASAVIACLFVDRVTSHLDAAEHCSTAWQLIAQAIASVGTFVMHCSTGSTECQRQQLLQQLCSNAQQLLAVPQLYSAVLDLQLCQGQTDASCNWCCPFSTRELQWLSWQLYNIVLQPTSSQQPDASVSTSDTNDPQGVKLSADLLLLSWQCSCAYLVKATASQQQQQQQQEVDSQQALTELLQRAQAYLSHLWCNGPAHASEQQRTGHQQQQQDSVQQVVVVTVAVAVLHLQQQDATDGRVERLLDKVLALYCKCRCRTPANSIVDSAVADQATGRCTKARSGTNRKQRCMQGHQQQQQQQQQLPSVLRLLIQQCKESSWQGPLDVVCWLEHRSLLRLVNDKQLSASAVTAAAAELLEELRRSIAPQGIDSSVFEARKQVTLGMMLSTASPDPAKGSSTSTGDGPAALSLAYSTALGMFGQQGSDAPTAAAKPSKGRGRQAARSSSKKNTPQQPGDATVDAEAAAALSSSLGSPAAAQVLACAAFSSCLLGLAEAAALMQQQQHQPGHSDIGLVEFDTSAPSDTNEDEADNSKADTPAAASEGWSKVQQHWQMSSKLFELLLQQQDSSSGVGFRCAVGFPLEVAVAAAEAWFIAGLQGWSSCRPGFAQVLQRLVPLLPPQQQVQMQQVLHLTSAATSNSWLWQLACPQRLNDVLQSSSQPSSSVRAPVSSARAGTGRGLRGAGRAANASDVNQPLLCCCLLQAERQLLLDGVAQSQQQQSSAGTPTPTEQLQQAQLLLAAGQAALASADAVAAIADIEAAIELSKAAMLGATGSKSFNGPHAVAGQLRKSACSNSLYWHAQARYMSGLLLLAELLELSGNPDDAIRVLKELVRISISCHCCCLGALAQATISSIHSKLGDDVRASGAAAAAAQWLQQYHQVQQQQCVAPQEHLWNVLVAAAVGQAQAACCVAAAQHSKAEQELRVQLDSLQTALQAAMSIHERPQHSDGCRKAPPSMLLWKAAAVRAQLQLQLSHVLVLTPGQEVAPAQLTVGLAELEELGMCARCCQTAWPAAHAALQLQQLLWTMPSSMRSQQAGQQALQLVGFNSSHADLQAEFACAASDNAVDVESTTDGSAVDAAPSKGRKGRSSRKQTSSTGDSDSSSCSRSAVAPQNPAVWLAEVLQLLPACSHDVLLLKDVCSHLSSMLQTYGAVHGAALLLQLSLGASVAQQQLLTVSSKLSKAQQRSSNASTGSSSDAAHPEQDSKIRIWEQLQQQLDLRPVLTDLAAAASPAHSGLLQPDSSSGAMAELLARIDVVGQRWLQQQLALFPQGTVACSVTVDCSSQCGAAPSGLLLPASAAMAEQNVKAGLLVCRLVPAATSAAGSSPPLPLCVRLHPTDGGCVGDLLSELSSILSDSSASMKVSEGICSNTPAAAKWWKQRVALDNRVSALLQQLDQVLLGPWRCLLMQPGQQKEEVAAQQRAQDFVAEHFESVFEEVPRQLLSQLVATLLVNLDACSTLELQRAVRELCQLTRHRGDGLHVSKLLAELSEHHAAVKAAASDTTATLVDVTNNQGDSGTQRRDAAFAGSSSSRRVSVANADDTSAVYATPAAPKARSRLGLNQTSASAKKVPRSRLKAMQKSSHSSSNPAGDDVSGLASLMASKLQLEEQQQQQEDGDGAAQEAGQPATVVPAAPEPKRKAKAPGTVARRVRFAQEDDIHPENEENQGPNASGQCCVPPASLARHAVRSRLQGMQGTCVSVAVAASAAVGDSGGGNEASQAPTTPAACKAPGRQADLATADVGIAHQLSSGPWSPSVLLLLDGDVQQLPWESCAGLKQQSIYRCPGLAVAAAAAARAGTQPHADRSSCSIISSSNASMSQVAACGSGASRSLQLSSSFYLLNPDGDLPATQNTFLDWLQQQLGLQGISGTRPSSSQLISDLQQHELFLYFGHGGGEQYVPLAALRRLDRCAGSLLMGCSSGRLKQAGLYEPSGAIWGYLMAGCPAAVANLWDVTDRDIDRFAQAVLQQWAGSNSTGRANLGSAIASSSSKRGADIADESISRSGHPGGVKMCSAVAASRQACRLPHLVGAAAVCYGLPTYVVQLDCCQR